MQNLTILAFLAASIFTIASAYKEFLKPNKSWLAFFGWILLIFLFVGLGIYEIVARFQSADSDKKEIIGQSTNAGQKTTKDVQRAIDSTRQSILDSIRFGDEGIKKQADSIARVKKDIQSVEKRPFIDLTGRGEHKNPEIIYSTDMTQATVKIYFSNTGNDVAINVVDDIFILNYVNGKIIYGTMQTGNAGRITNKATSIAPKDIDMASFGMNVPKNPFAFPSYIYIKLNYTNSMNKKMPPLRKILAIKPEGTEHLAAEEYDKIEDAIKKEKIY